MFTSVVRLLFLIFFLIIVSQGIFYLFALSKAFSEISITAYAEIRNSTDRVIEWRLKFVYPMAVLLGLITTLSLIKSPGSLAFITAAIACACLLIDLILAIKFNMPINALFNEFDTGFRDLDWESLRRTWLKFMCFRGVIQVLGFLSLLVGLVKG